MGTSVRAILVVSFGLISVGPAWAHEHEHTHAGLTSAIVQLLEIYWDREGLNPNQRPTIPDVFAARDGSIREDDCPRYYSHFYNPNTPTLAGSNVEPGDFIDNNCSWTDDPANVGKIGAEQYFIQALATDRAGELWDCALQTYRGHGCTEPTLLITHPAGRETAFGLLGRVLHLLEDMTSPAHTFTTTLTASQASRGLATAGARTLTISRIGDGASAAATRCPTAITDTSPTTSSTRRHSRSR